VTSLRDAAKAAKLNADLSQCFLVDNAILREISEAVVLPSRDTPLIEIGPGTGHLTRYLLDSAKSTNLTLIEVDDRFIEDLRALSTTVEVLHQDIRRVDLAALITSKRVTPEQKAVIVGNLPYHLTGPILFQLFGEIHEVSHPTRTLTESALLMVQKEVGERLMAKPGDSAFSQLTLQLQCWVDIQPVLSVPKTAFEPVPKVDSMVLRVTPRAEPLVSLANPSAYAALGSLIKAAFCHRRKTLANNLKMAGFPAESVTAALAEAGLSPTARPQEVSLEDYAGLLSRLTRVES
jgi:16S rRNA (adenine1518-N6/adenine1519-N6)-dimethyltransferase